MSILLLNVKSQCYTLPTVMPSLNHSLWSSLLKRPAVFSLMILQPQSVSHSPSKVHFLVIMSS